MILRKATETDFEAICELYQHTIGDMEESGSHQWKWGVYPDEEMIREDIAAGRLFCLYGEYGMSIAVTVGLDMEDAYQQVNWLFGVRPGVFHRLAVRPELQGDGLGHKAVEDVINILVGLGCDCLRCYVGKDNRVGRSFYRSLGMREAGPLRFEGRDEDYIAYERRLTEDCPLLPLRMTPAFRSGKLTPWGGDKLQTVFHKNIPETPTGESLEVSCIPGLESRDVTGITLPELIRQYGHPFAGAYVFRDFPLLLKLIDATDTLSVQVHPGDAYAAEHEGGKLGKTEAWLILDAPEGAELVYGIQPGVTLEELRAACEQGAAVEPLLRRVQVRAGDVCFIPSGCVHAIGAGITLYEIQQSSDITYRFYDWDRVDAHGNRRELHLDKALDVTDLSFRLDPVHAPDGARTRVLDTAYFTLDLLRGNVPVPPIRHFAMLTALGEDVTLTWDSDRLELKKGETVFLPASCPALTVRGADRAAVAMPKD